MVKFTALWPRQLGFCLGLMWLPGSLLAIPSPKRMMTDPLANPYFTGNYDFEGIVSLSNCSGGLVRFEDSHDDDLALVLTNGHCVSLMDPGVVKVDQASSRTFRLLTPAGGSGGQVRAQRLVYATMTDTDMALYRLTSTYGDIAQAYGINALTLSSTSPDQGDAIDVLSGYWKRGFTCEIEKVVFKLQEGDWFFKESLRYSRPGCDTYGGTSGSPVVLSGTKAVVAVNNTGNESGRKCQVNNPCEIDPKGTITYQKGYSYAQQTAWIYTCRDENGELDLNRLGCQLPRPQ